MSAINTIRPELLSFGWEQLRLIAPVAIVFLGAVVAMLLGTVKVVQPKWPVVGVALAALVLAVAASVDLLPIERTSLFNEMFVVDRFSSLFGVVFLFSGIVTILASTAYLDREGLQYPDYYVLVLFGCVGMMLMASTLDLISIFISLEVMSLAVYVLVGFRRVDRRSNEAALKYFILGSVASAVLLYGTALIYGATQSTNLKEIFQRVHEHPELMTPIFALGACFLVAGFLFKVAAFPFHMWMPDVYEGAPTPVTGFMTTGLKAAAFAVFARALALIGYGDGLSDVLQGRLHDVLWVCAVATMLVGNLSALKQTNLKRILAFSSIAHTGYLLVGFIAARTAGPTGFAPVLLYMIAYTIMNLGAFTVLSMISGKNDAGINLHDLSGLSQTKPHLAFALSVFLFSMAGVPPTAGFVAKYLLFYGAVQGGETLLVVLAVLTSAVAAYYYLRAMVYMYMKEPIPYPSPVVASGAWAMPGAMVAIVLTVVLTLQFGIAPGHLVEVAKRALVN